MFCSKCGTQLDETAQFCSKCGSPTGSQQAFSTPAPTAASGAGVLAGNVGAASHPQVIIVRSAKSAGLAAVLSFFWCGLGQIYNGQIGKGIIFGILYFFSFLLMFALIGLFTTPVLWIWGMVDAYRTSEQINQRNGVS